MLGGLLIVSWRLEVVSWRLEGVVGWELLIVKVGLAIGTEAVKNNRESNSSIPNRQLPTHNSRLNYRQHSIFKIKFPIRPYVRLRAIRTPF